MSLITPKILLRENNLSDKIKLNMMERFNVLNLLPAQGDYTTLKILRKLRESLAPDEKENEEYKFWHEFQCPFVDYSDRGKREKCEYTKEATEPPKCPIHDKLCVPNGKLFWSDELATKQKEIWLGDKAKSLIVDALKALEDDKRLSQEDGTLNLYEKFVEGGE